MRMNDFLYNASIKRMIVTSLCLVLCFVIFSATGIAASDTTVEVTAQSQITKTLKTAVAGDRILFVLQNNITLGGSGTEKIEIPSGVTATFVNKEGVKVSVIRYPFNDGKNSRFNVSGTLIINENTDKDGSLSFNGGSTDFSGEPLFASVADTGCKMIFNGGKFQSNKSDYGVIFSCDGANTIINDGTFLKNENGNSGMQGGVIYAANSTLTINGGSFTDNKAKDSGGVIFYEGRKTESNDNKLTITGGVFDGNTCSGLGGGVLFITQSGDSRSVAEITGGQFTNNTSKIMGGAIYISQGAEVTMAHAYIYENKAGTLGGGIWNCPTGGGEYYSFHGMYLSSNTAVQGDDFYSDEKTGSNPPNVYLTDYAFNGDAFKWLYDADNAERGNPAPNDYYQNTKNTIALKSQLEKKDALLKEKELVVLSGNTSDKSGGAIANNGYLNIGEESALSVNKQTTVATEETFTFSLSLTRDGKGMPGSFVYKDSSTKDLGRIVFDSTGDASISLKAGQTITILDLPVNSHFEIKEVSMPKGWELKSSSNGTINIPLDAKTVPKINAVFNNGPIETGSLLVSKTVTGEGADLTKSFDFTVTITDASGNSLSGTYGGLIFASGKTTFRLGNGDTKTIDDLPANATYTVTEDSAGYTATKSGDTGTIIANGTATAKFNNNKNAAATPVTTGSLTVSKTVSGSGASTAQEFTFTVTLGDTTINGTYGDMSFTKGVATFKLKANESKTASGLPANVTYTVTENSAGYTVTKTGDTGTIAANATATAKFDNHKDSAAQSGTTQNGTTQSSAARNTSVSPQTGDNSDMVLWMFLLVCSFGGITALLIGSKRKHNLKYEKK